jgi:hypothetical protein
MKQLLLSTAIFLMTTSANHSSAQNNNDVGLNLKSLISATLIEKASEAKSYRSKRKGNEGLQPRL